MTTHARTRHRILTAAALSACAAVLPARANTDIWTGTTGNWNTGSNWSLGTAPASGDTVSLTQTDSVNRTVTLNVSPPSLSSLTIDSTGTGLMVLSQSANSLSTSNGENIGNSGTAIYNQTGGAHSANAPLRLGYNAGSNGTYSLSGTGSLYVASVEYIGWNGNGTLIQTGGTNSLGSTSGAIDLAWAAGSSGTYTLSGGTATTLRASVGGSTGAPGGAGVLTISGTGAFTATSRFQIWDTPGTAVNLAGGSLTVGTFYNTNSSRFNWTAGTLAVTNSTFGTELLGTSSTLSPAQSLNVGTYFNLTTGTSFTLAGGSVTTNFLSRSPTPGTFAWTSGTLTVKSALDASYLGPSTTLTPAHTLVSGQLTIPAGTTVSLAGGTLTTVQLTPNAPGAFSWTSGTLNITDMGLSVGPINLGANPTLTSAQTLSVSGSNPLYINFGTKLTVAGATVSSTSAAGTTVAGSLTLTSGAVSTTTLSVGNSTIAGALTVSGGSLSVAGSLNHANDASTFSVSGGSVSVGGTLSAFGLTFTGGTITADSVIGPGSGFNWTAGTFSLTNATSSTPSISPISPGKTLVLAAPFKPASGASVSLNGGTLRVPSIDLTNNPGGLAWTSGTLAITNTSAFSPSSTNLGTSVTLGPDMTLSLAYDLSLTSTGTRRTLTVTGGRADVGRNLFVNGGQFTLSDGSVNVTTAESIYAATGAVTQTGGTHAITGSLSVGLATGGSGAYTLSGGQVSAATISVGSTSNSAAGTLNITGGAMTSAGTLRVYNNPATSLSLSGGTLSLASLDTQGNPANFHWTAGTLSFTSAPPDISPTGPLGPSVTLSADMTLRTTALPTIAPTSTLDIAGGTLLISYAGPSPADSLRSLLLAGRITSSATDPTHRLAYLDPATLSGEPTAPVPTLTVTLALAGDTNLNGTIDPDDYTLLDRTFAKGTTNAHWTDGDFNYDGQITPADYLLLDTTYLQQQGGTPSPAFLAQRESRFGDAYVSQLLTSLPEPSSLACLFATLPLLPRRRTKS